MIEVEDRSEKDMQAGVSIGMLDGRMVLQAQATSGVITILVGLEDATKIRAAITRAIIEMKRPKVVQ